MVHNASSDPKVKIPTSLERDLIKDSVIEIRFDSKIAETQVFPAIFKIIVDEFPNYRESEIPYQLKNFNPLLKYAVTSVMSNADFSIGFSSNVIVFNCVNGYKGWNNFIYIIKKYLQIFYEKIFNTIERIGVRYVNVFEKSTNLSKNILLDVKFRGIENYQTTNVALVMQLQKQNYQFNLNIADSAIINGRPGSLLDIDVYVNNPVINKIEDLLEMISNIHQEEKILFFNILREEFVNELGPTY